MSFLDISAKGIDEVWLALISAFYIVLGNAFSSSVNEWLAGFSIQTLTSY